MGFGEGWVGLCRDSESQCSEGKMPALWRPEQQLRAGSSLSPFMYCLSFYLFNIREAHMLSSPLYRWKS